MERNLTQREYEELNSRREAAGRPPLSYRDANRQARRPTTRQRQARQQGVGVEGSGTEVSSEAGARPYTAEAETAEGRAGQQFPELHLDRGVVGPRLGSMELAGYSLVGAPGLCSSCHRGESTRDGGSADRHSPRCCLATVSTDEEECSREIPAPTATGAMEGGVRIDPTDLFDAPLTASDLPEDSSRAEKLSKMMTAALRHKPGNFQIEL